MGYTIGEVVLLLALLITLFMTGFGAGMAFVEKEFKDRSPATVHPIELTVSDNKELIEFKNESIELGVGRYHPETGVFELIKKDNDE